jgi:hypothetical protein
MLHKTIFEASKQTVHHFFPLGAFFISGNKKSFLVHDQMNKVGD